ncbi:hypothetical protein QR98_0029590 [Sarcoptes scabiei]|uniref:Uncharacterized protein n=1 Tax=Sarcoptes scabiei TaxID=52283 RepID=A0A132A2E6_SARSC|nr:hypothetical protein QR98_0029590 [Sarcoptes scabiei]
MEQIKFAVFACVALSVGVWVWLCSNKELSLYSLLESTRSTKISMFYNACMIETDVIDEMRIVVDGD